MEEGIVVTFGGGGDNGRVAGWLLLPDSHSESHIKNLDRLW